MKDLQYYLTLPFTVLLRPEPDGNIVARIDELPGCSTDGSTIPEALEKLDELKQAWIEDALEAGHAIPEPSAEEVLPSGKWVQRVPRSLHRKLSVAAKKDGVSLNSLVSGLLAEAMGARAERQKAEQVGTVQMAEVQPEQASASWHDATSLWHDPYANWIDAAYTIVTHHNARSGCEPLGLADRLHLLSGGYSNKYKKPFKAFDDEEKTQTFGKA